MLQAASSRAQQDTKAEREHLVALLDQAPDYAGLIVAELQANFSATNECDVLLARLGRHYEQYPSLDLFDVVFRLTWSQDGAQAAWLFAQRALTAHPSLLGLERALSAQAKADVSQDPTPVQGLVSRDLLRQLVSRHTQRLDRYSCRVCGFQARAFYWQCPGCHGWETYQPRRLEEIQASTGSP